MASGGEEVTGYIVHRSHGAGGADHSTVVDNGTGSTEATATVVELEGGRLYAFVVSGVSAAGEGDVSAEAATQSTSPSAPSGLTSVLQTTSSITLEWTAPLELGGDTVSEYVLYMDDGSGESAAVSTEAYRGELSSSMVVEGLVGGRS